MSQKLNSFLVDLVSDPERMARFLNAPEQVLAEADLTDDQKAAVMSRDSRRLAAAMGAVTASNGNVQQLTITLLGVPIGDGETMSIGNVQNVTIGNVQNVTIGNVRNVAASAERSSKSPAATTAKKQATKSASKPR